MQHIYILIVTFIALSLAHADKQPGGFAYQKPGADIRLASPEFIQLDPHATATVSVTFSTPGSGELILSAKTKEGLTLENNLQQRYDLSKGKPALELSLRAGEAGEYHIMFHATIEGRGMRSSRVFGIPVYVGERQTQAKAQKAHPKYIIMQGEETIR